MTRLADAPATSRNREPILEVLKQELRDCRNVLEIGSGTGQHAVYFAEHLPTLRWQTSDREENLANISNRLNSVARDNIGEPLALDVLHDEDPDGAYDGIFSANTAHIMSIQAVVALFALVGRLLPEGAPFCLYGPFRIDGEFTSDSNEQFDTSLKQRDSAMGIRDLEYLDELAALAQLQRTALYAMPANNFIAVWRKMATVAGSA
ncbi:DUF938 domain-containing protein [Woeseia oceani]|uniref:Methylase n=1 Tax=Woeseia oceani TaxID=1548547 RepID=A0A193LGS0_9GAMM|nr:DUF938 domain-containing protein [Woeseia oceani]ANO51559.1 hypothetical protein BA177_10395 [Woeseia oceani]